MFTVPDSGIEGEIQSEDETVIRLVGNVDPIPMGKIRMEPRKTIVGELTANEENQVQVVLENEGDATLTVSRILSTKFDVVYYDADDSGSITIPAGQKQTVKFFVTPVEQGRFLDTIMIHSDARNDIGNGYKGLLSGTVK